MKGLFNINIKISHGWFWGVVLILGAVMLIMDRLALLPSVLEGMTAWTLFLSVIMVGWFVSCIAKANFGVALFPLAILFMLTKESIAALTSISSIGEISGWMILIFAVAFSMGWSISGSISAGIITVLAFLLMLFKSWLAQVIDLPQLAQLSNWIILLCTVLVVFGLKMIFGKKECHTTFKKHINSKIEHNGNSSSSSFGDHVKYIDCGSFDKATVSNSFGETNIYFQNISRYAGDATLNVSNSFGELDIHVPDSWKIVSNVSNAFGNTNIPTNSNSNGKVLYIKGSNSFGELAVYKMHYDDEVNSEFEVVVEGSCD